MRFGLPCSVNLALSAFALLLLAGCGAELEDSADGASPSANTQSKAITKPPREANPHGARYWLIDREYTDRILADMEREDPQGPGSALLRSMLQSILAQNGPVLMTTGDSVTHFFRDRKIMVPAVFDADGNYRAQDTDGKETHLVVEGTRLIVNYVGTSKPLVYRQLFGEELVKRLAKLEAWRLGPGPDASPRARFHWILNAESSKVAEKLAREPDLIHVATDSGERLIHLAARGDDKSLTARLIELGTEVNAVNRDGETPLLEHVSFGTDPDIVRMLVEAGADVNLANNDGNTPLWIAVARGHGNDVKRLLDAGADPSIGLSDRKMPLTFAVLGVRRSENKHAAEVIGALAGAGVDLDARAGDGPGTFAGETALHRAIHQNSLPTVRAFLAHGADPNALDDEGRTPLLDVVNFGYDEADVAQRVALLLEHGADPNLADRKFGFSPLSAAVRRGEGDLEVPHLLLEAGADPNIVAGPFKRTAIAEAMRECRLPLVELLLSESDDPNVVPSSLDHCTDEEPRPGQVAQ